MTEKIKQKESSLNYLCTQTVIKCLAAMELIVREVVAPSKAPSTTHPGTRAEQVGVDLKRRHREQGSTAEEGAHHVR
jgi:hypothetical protein